MLNKIKEELYELIQQKEVSEKLILCKSPEECYMEVSKYVKDITMDEFYEYMKEIHKYCQESQEGLLSDEELESVGGGLSDQGAGAIVSSGVTVVAAASLAL